MSRVNLPDPERLPDDLRGIPGVTTIMAKVPTIARAWRGLEAAFWREDSTLTPMLREQARRSLAKDIGCRFCDALGEVTNTPEDNREALAIAFAELLATDHHQITDQTFDLLREEFTEEEIVDLVAWLCYKFAGNLFGAVMQISPPTPEELVTYQRNIGIA